MDCKILQQVSAELGTKHCEACFPRFFYLSPQNATGICYLEFVPSVPIPVYLDSVNVTAEVGFHALKHTVVQVLGALQGLKNQQVRHNDLSFRNILVRVGEGHVGTGKDGNLKSRSVVVMDFGESTLRAVIGYCNSDIMAGMSVGFLSLFA